MGFDEDVAAINELLPRFGIESDLETFLADHLTGVFRQQHRDAIIESITFRGAQGISGGGMQIPNSSIVNCETICIPMDLTVVVASNNQRAELDLHFRLTANYIDGTYRAKSDVIVQRQTAV